MSQGDPGGHAALVSSQVKLARASGGRERRVDLIGPAGQFAEVSVLDPGPRSATGSAWEVVHDAPPDSTSGCGVATFARVGGLFA